MVAICGFFVKVVPWVAWLSVFLTVCVALPLTLVKATRKGGSTFLLFMAWPFFLCAWALSFTGTYAVWGSTGVIIGLILAGVGEMLTGAIATLMAGLWPIFIPLVVLFGLGVACLALGGYFGEKAETAAKTSAA